MKRPSKPARRLWLALLLVMGIGSVDRLTAEPAGKEPEQTKDSHAYVLFLNKPRKLTVESLRAGLAKGWQLTPEVAGKLKIKEAEGEFTVHFQGVDYLVDAAPVPWMEDQPQVIEEATDLRMKEMLRHVTSHLAVTVDHHFPNEGAQQQAADNQLRLLGGLIEPEHTLAVYDDDNGDFNYLNGEVQAALTGENPHECFDLQVTPPAMLIDPQQPAMQAAIAEARRCWPEFAKNFREYSEERAPFLIKSGFGEGTKREYLWLEVFAIQSGKIRASLKSDPSQTSRLSKGEELEIPLSELADWMYPDEDGSSVGGFSLGVTGEP